VAWTYRTGDMQQPVKAREKAAFEATPILVEGKLFLSTPYNRVIALDPRSGVRLWEFDPHSISIATTPKSPLARLGLARFQGKGGQPCRLRIFVGTLDARLIAPRWRDRTGLPGLWHPGSRRPHQGRRDPDGLDGRLSGHLCSRDRQRPGDRRLLPRGQTGEWTPDVGSSVPSTRARAHCVDLGSHPLGQGDGAPHRGRKRLVHPLRRLRARPRLRPDGQRQPGLLRRIRKGDNKWPTRSVALRASTGRFVWGFQVVHHDLWDYDVASQPALIAWKDRTPAVGDQHQDGPRLRAEPPHRGSLLPVEERAVPQSDIPGEQSWPTQPSSSISLVPERLLPGDAWGPTPEDLKWCQDKIKASRNQGIFTPRASRAAGVSPATWAASIGAAPPTIRSATPWS